MHSFAKKIEDIEIEPSNLWRLSGSPVHDEVENARMSGIEIGMQEREKIIQNQHITLRNTAFNFSESIYSRMKEKFKIEPVGMRMRTVGFSSFDTLFMLRPDDFYSDKVEEIYVFLNEERKKIASISWDFVLMAATSALNESAISSDGFTLSYAESP